MSRQQGTPAWVYLVAGCAGLVVMALVGVGVIGYLGYRWTREVERTQKDPVARTGQALEVLGAERVPEGYHTMAAVSIPFLVDVVVLSDREPDERGVIHGFDDRGFIYLKMIHLGSEQRELRDYFEGKTDAAEALEKSGIRLRTEEILTRGVLEADGLRLLYVAQRGGVEAHGGHADGLTSLILVECPRDEKLRMGIWFGPDPTDGETAELGEMAGTPADEEAILGFMSHFSPCAG